MIMAGRVATALILLLRSILSADRHQHVTFERGRSRNRGLRQKTYEGGQQQGKRDRMDEPAA